MGWEKLQRKHLLMPSVVIDCLPFHIGGSADD